MTTLAEAKEAISRMVRNHPEQTWRILARHGATIEAKAAVLTPVDTGALRRATGYEVDAKEDAVSLTIANRMIYAHYQHERVMRHSQPQARDHFISIPFEAELPLIVDDIVQADLKEATTE